MHKFLKKMLAAGLTAALCSWPAQGLALDPIMPYEEVSSGAEGTAYTVLDNSGEIESFGVSIIGNMAGGKGSVPMIMARAEGEAVERVGGVLQGMSGSPVYVDGRLVGAVAAGVDNMTPFTFFIMPIEQMLPLWDMPDTKNQTRVASVDLKKYAEERARKAEEEKNKDKGGSSAGADKGAEPAEEAKTGAEAADKAETADKVEALPKDETTQDKAGVKEETTQAKDGAKEETVPEEMVRQQEEPAAKDTVKDTEPEAPAETAVSNAEAVPEVAEAPEAGEPMEMLFATGFNAEGLNFLQTKLGFPSGSQFQPLGFEPEPGTGMLTTDYNAVLYPGSPVGVAVVYGDFSVGATGTVTATDEDRILAFGHAFMHRGNVNYFMTDASVVGTISGQSSGMKIANMGHIIGRISQDRETGISGTLGDFPTVVPMKIHVEDKTLFRSDDYGVRIAYDEDYLAQLTGAVAYASLAKTSDAQSAATASLSFSIRTDAVEDGVVTRKNMFYNPTDVGQIAVGELMQAMDYICTNTDKESSILDVQVDISVESGRKTATLISAIPEKSTVKPGETVNFTVTLKPYRGVQETLTIPYTVPKNQLSGRMNLDIRGGGFVPVNPLSLMEAANLASPDGPILSTSEKLEKLMDTSRNNEIIIAPGAAQQPLSEKEQQRILKEASEAAKKKEAQEHKVEFLKEEVKHPKETRFETGYVIDNVIHGMLQIEKPE